MYTNDLVELLAGQIGQRASQIITGRLFTPSQIRTISNNAVGKYFQDWLPVPDDDSSPHARVEEAKRHITSASSIILSLQSDLENQSNQLEQLLTDIEEKKEMALHYSSLASLSQEEFALLKSEMANVFQTELENESNKGKGTRQFLKVVEIVVTLIIGAALGEYFGEIVSFIQSVFS